MNEVDPDHRCGRQDRCPRGPKAGTWHALRAVSRRTPLPFDWLDRRTWAPALHGAARAYVTFQPDLAIDGADADIAELARLGREAGLDQMVLLSGCGEPSAQRARRGADRIRPGRLERGPGQLVCAELLGRGVRGWDPRRAAGPARRSGARTVHRRR